MAGGMDFADALHLAGCNGCDRFLTFDRKFLRAAKGKSAIALSTP